MIFTEQHSYQNDATIQQILVFENHQDKHDFDVWYADEVKYEGITHASVCHYAVKYILRAVLCSDVKYTSIIRESNGNLVWQDHVTYDTAEEALCVARKVGILRVLEKETVKITELFSVVVKKYTNNGRICEISEPIYFTDEDKKQKYVDAVNSVFGEPSDEFMVVPVVSRII